MKKINVLTKILCFIAALGIIFIVTGCSGVKIRESYETTPSEMSSHHVGPGEHITINQQILPSPKWNNSSQWNNTHRQWDNTSQKIYQAPNALAPNTVVVVVIMEKQGDKIVPHAYIKNSQGKWQETNQIPDGAKSIVVPGNKGEK